jgi:hypothetical protein
LEKFSKKFLTCTSTAFKLDFGFKLRVLCDLSDVKLLSVNKHFKKFKYLIWTMLKEILYGLPIKLDLFRKVKLMLGLRFWKDLTVGVPVVLTLDLIFHTRREKLVG